jgi:putative FmdB family regulatory protein
MPIYEFYCQSCHTIFSFFSSVVSSKRPACPRCGAAELPRRPSSFAIGGAAGEDEEDPLFAGLDEDRVESAMGSLMGEMEGMADDADPRALGKLLHRFTELSGLEPGPRMEEMLSRLAAGEDPDDVESTLGEDGDDDLEDLFRLKRRLGRAARPRVDEEMHFL